MRQECDRSAALSLICRGLGNVTLNSLVAFQIFLPLPLPPTTPSVTKCEVCFGRASRELELILRSHSQSPPSGLLPQPQGYLAVLSAMTKDLPPTALVASGETGEFISVQM